VKDEVNMQVDDHVVVEGIISGGASIPVVQIKTLRSLDGIDVESGISNAVISISGAGETYILTESPDDQGLYKLEEGFVGIPGAEYKLQVLVGDQKLSASTIVPPLLTITSQTDTEISVDPEDYGVVVFEMEWDNAGDFAYVLSLENLDPDSAPVQLSFESGTFGVVYGLPIQENGLSLNDHSFYYYGSQELSVYRVDRLYESIFYSNDGSDIQDYDEVDNIEGGSGHFTAVSTVSVVLQVEEL
jgi:hypothetical protein